MKRSAPPARKNPIARRTPLRATRAGVRRSADTRRARAEKAKETGVLYRLVEARAGGKCEHCGRRFSHGELTPEMDHQASRRVPQTVENCILLCRACHRNKTENKPSRLACLLSFALHCEAHGYDAEHARAVREAEWVTSKTEARHSPG